MRDGNKLGYDRGALLCRRCFFVCFFLLFYNTEGVLYCHCLISSMISGRIITGSRLWRVEPSMIAIHDGCGDTRLAGVEGMRWIAVMTS